MHICNTFLTRSQVKKSVLQVHFYYVKCIIYLSEIVLDLLFES